MTSFSTNLAALARRVVGLSANNLVALDGSGKLPALDGSQLRGLGGSMPKAIQKISASGIYTPTPGTKFVLIIARGGGAGGNGGSPGASGATGFSFVAIDDTKTYPVVIGAGSAGSSGQSSSNGGSTYITIDAAQHGASGGGGAGFDGGQYWPGKPLTPLPATQFTLTLQRPERDGISSSYQEAMLGTYYGGGGAARTTGNPGVLAILEFGA